VARKYGEENIASFVIHLDETNPHLHCTLLPIKDGKFAYKKLFAGSNLYDYKDKMRQLHDEFADVTAKWGFSRGSDVAKTGARNIPPHEYRRLLSPKFAYNLSENRILQMLQSMQTKIPQSSLNNWMHQLMTYMRISLENLLIDAVKRSYFTHNDEVRILVRSREAADAPFEYKVEYIHAALSLEQKLVVMLYKNEGSRGHEVPEEYLFKGSIDKCFCSDRAKLYETIETDLIQYRIVRASCWFHARHYFVDAYITDHRVYDIIRMINFLFRVDREAKERGLTPEQRFKFRLRYSRKIVTQIIKRLKEIRAAGNEYGELVHRAVNYILDDEKSFLKFLQDGRIELSNNAIERAFRHIAIGRRNWLHTGSHFAAENIAFMYSLYECCKLNDLNFGEYIEDVLIRFMKGEKADESFLPNQYTIKYINKKEQEEEGADKATA
jgi:hypothetical protein